MTSQTAMRGKRTAQGEMRSEGISTELSGCRHQQWVEDMGLFKQQGFTKPDTIIIHDEADFEPQVRDVVGFLVHSIAFCEAANHLITTGDFLNTDTSRENLMHLNAGITAAVVTCLTCPQSLYHLQS